MIFAEVITSQWLLKTSLRDNEPVAEHWKFDRADWMSFRTLSVSRLFDELALSEDPVAQFTDTLIEIANQTMPKFLKTNSRKYRSLTMFVN